MYIVNEHIQLNFQNEVMPNYISVVIPVYKDYMDWKILYNR